MRSNIKYYIGKSTKIYFVPKSNLDKRVLDT